MSRKFFQRTARRLTIASVCALAISALCWVHSYYGRWSVPAVVGGNRPQIQSADGHLFVSWVQTRGPGPSAVQLHFSATEWQSGAPYPWIRLAQGPLPAGGTIVAPPLVFESARLKNGLGFDRGTIRLSSGKRALIVDVASIPYWPLVTIAGLGWCFGKLLGRLLRPRIQPGICANCGYDLRASPERCPECGASPTNAVG